MFIGYLIMTYLGILLILVFGILSIVQFLKKNNKKGIRLLMFAGISVLVVIFSFVASLFALPAPESTSEEKIEVSADALEVEVEQEELTPEDKERINKNYQEIQRRILEDDIVQIINDTLGETNNLDKSTVESVEVSEDKIAISLNGSDNVTNNAVKEMMWMDSAKILELIEEESGSKDISVNWQFPLVDTYGNETDEVVMSFDLDRETLNKINWENFSSDNIPNISKNYYEHAAFNK